MQMPVEIHYRDVEKTDAIDRLVRQKVDKLDRVFDRLISCRVAIERPQKPREGKSPYRVRIEVTAPPGHDLVVRREPGEARSYESLRTILVGAFKAMREQLASLRGRQREPAPDGAADGRRRMPPARAGQLARTTRSRAERR
jgi:ribosome-associated translation inhibitor RaiA